MVPFFINRPIVAMVISILMVIVGAVSVLGLPVSQFPSIVPPEVQINATYVGADSLTVEQSVATPIEQQMSGVDSMNYMYSINSSTGGMRMIVDFDVKSDPNTDLVLARIREQQAEPQLPADVRNYGVSVQKSLASPLMLIGLYSPNGAYDSTFLANYAYINMVDPLTRVPGVGSVLVFGAGQYAMRFWVNPDQLAKLQITVPEILSALAVQNTVNPAGSIGSEPVPAGQEFTYSVRAQGRLVTPEEFGEIVVRANPDGSIVRLRDVARVELGAQVYNIRGRLDGKPSAIIAVYQLPGSNAVEAAAGVRRLIEELKGRFPADLDYLVSLDTTHGRDRGDEGNHHHPLRGPGPGDPGRVRVPPGMAGHAHPAAGRAGVAGRHVRPVPAVRVLDQHPLALRPGAGHRAGGGRRHRRGRGGDAQDRGRPGAEGSGAGGHGRGLQPDHRHRPDPGLGVPADGLPAGHHRAVVPAVRADDRRLGDPVGLQRADASPALAALLLRPKRPGRGPVGWFFAGFNRVFGRATDGYVAVSRVLIRRAVLSLALLALVAAAAGWFGRQLPAGFLPDEDQGYVYVNLQLPDAASLQRTDEAARQVEKIILDTPGVDHCTTVCGFSLLSLAQTTYNAFFFVTLKDWHARTRPEEQYQAIQAHLNEQLAKLPQGTAFAFSPPAIPGVGRSGGVTFMLEDRSGGDVAFLAENVQRFLEAARKRPEVASINSSMLPSVPQVFARVDRDKALKQGVPLDDVYQTLQAFMGGYFVNYFNRFGRQWQVYVQAEGQFRTRPENIGQFYVRNSQGQMVPLSTLVTIETRSGPEFTLRYNVYRCAQINVTAAPGRTSAQAMQALEETFRQTMPREMGYDYLGMSFQEKKAQEGVPAMAVYGLSLLFVFLILAAQYESWSLPFSVLLSTPVAVFGALGTLWLRRQDSLVFEDNIYAQIGIVMLIGLAAKNAPLPYCRLASIGFLVPTRPYDFCALVDSWFVQDFLVVL